MGAKELRINNILQYEGDICDVKEIDEHGVKVLFKNGELVWIEIYQFEPIPITEEWLLKFGFEKFQLGIFRKGDWYIDLISKTWKFHREYQDIHFQYVHQLQNLFYSLTGSELEFKK